MKNVTVFLNFIQESTQSILHSSTEYGLNHRQGRTYGPLVGLFLATLLTKALAKYAASSFLPANHSPWVPQSHKPVNYISYNQIHQPNSLWQPSSPYLHGLTAFAADNYHDSYSQPEHHTVVNINEEHPTEHVQFDETPPPGHIQNTDAHHIATTIEIPELLDQIPSQSQLNYRRQRPPNRWVNYNHLPRRENQNRNTYDYPRNRNQGNRFRTTTPYYDYNYDSYDDFAPTRYTPHRTRRPPYRRRPVDNYDYSYENSEYDDSYYDDVYHERTTKPYKRKRKPTKRMKFKKRKDVTEEESKSDSDSVEISEEEEIKESREKAKEKEIKVKPKQQTTASTSTESTESTTTTEAPTTTVTTTSSSSTTPANQNNTGYGPGGGHDNISFTYGPPVVHQQYGPLYNDHHYGYGSPHGSEGVSITYNPPIFPLFHHNYPYANWIPQEVTKNAIVKKVHDLVGFDEDFVHRV